MHKRRPEDDLVAQVEHHEEDQTDVRDEEVARAEAWDPRGEALGEDNQGVEKEPVPGKERLPHRLVGKDVARDVAGFQSPHKGEVAGIQGCPGDETRHTGDVQEPVEHGAAPVGEIEECKQAKGGGDRNAVVRHSALGCALEDPRCEAFLGKADQDAAAAVDVRVGSRENDG